MHSWDGRIDEWNVMCMLSIIIENVHPRITRFVVVDFCIQLLDAGGSQYQDLQLGHPVNDEAAARLRLPSMDQLWA